jgi:hypothetical protein
MADAIRCGPLTILLAEVCEMWRGGSTGGGVSDVGLRPNWQAALTVASVNPGAIVGRVLPDVAANADWNALR